MINKFFAAILPFSLTASFARRLLSILGFGAGTDVNASGEIVAMEAAMKMACVDSKANPVLFDVGANTGAWTSAALSAFPKAQIHAFEPSKSHQMLYLKLHASNDAVILNNFALAATSGTATLYKDADVTGLASLTARDLSHIGIVMDLAESVELDTLDAYAARVGITQIDFVKIDVEGHELDVLRGATRMLAEKRIRAVQFEFGGTNIDTRTFFKDFFSLFTGLGYAVHIIRPGGRLYRLARYREFYEQFRTTNYIAVVDSKQR